MGTEVVISFNNLRTQLENEKSSLYKIDESIKKIVQSSGRYPNDRFNNSAGEYGRGPRTGKNFHPDGANKSDDPSGKRKHETKTVFSRLSARVNDSDGETEDINRKPRMSSTVWRELPSRAEVLRAQGTDEQSRVRNRRIFSSLLGTLQKFKQEEIVMQTKEEKKAQVERKIEEQARLEKEREQKERKTLFAERELKKATIKALEAKMGRVQEFERWEAAQKPLTNFILTKAKPHMYWLPKKMNDKAAEKLTSSKKYHERYMAKKRQDLHEELQRIEQATRRPRGPAAKENNPQVQNPQEEHSKSPRRRKDSKGEDQKLADGDDKSKKRDKFAMEVDVKEEESEDDMQHTPTREQSDHQDKENENKPEEIEQKESQPEKKETPMDTDEPLQQAMEQAAPQGPSC
ncbi:Pinin [Eumeta japonica]|uniref:Pinin n=1 Tax=Eumeta variegata TaxID=151549 RepID=A0A4C2AG66_EUMVA|nr:Pinin [Eumeta japonica]